MITIKEALTNYWADLRYNGLHCGRETLNDLSCGTPYFESDDEMTAYFDAIERLLSGEGAA